MSYNPFSITNLYDIKNRNQNNTISQNMSQNYQQNRDTSPITNLQSNNGLHHGLTTQNSSSNYYQQQQSPIQNTTQGYQYQLNSHSSQPDFQASRQAHSPLNHTPSSQMLKTQNSSINQQQMQNSQAISGGAFSGIPQYQHVFQQTKPLNQNSGITSYQNGYASQSPQNGIQNGMGQSREKSPIGVNNTNNNSGYNINQNIQMNQSKISPGGAQIPNDSSISKQPQQAVKGSLSPLNRLGYQSKYSNMNFTNYAQSKQNVGNNVNLNPQNNLDEKNKLIHQSQQFGSASPLMSQQNQQQVNQSVQGPLTNIKSMNGSQSPYNQRLNNNYTNEQNMQQTSNINSTSQKEIGYSSSGFKSARNVKEQIKQIGNTISTTHTSSKNAQAPLIQRAGFKSNEGIEDNSSNTRLQTAPNSSGPHTQRLQGTNYGNNNSNQNYLRPESSPYNKVSSYQTNYRQQTPPASHNNYPVPASIPSNLVQNNNMEIKKVQHSNHQTHSTEAPLQNKTNEYSLNNKNQFQSDQKPTYQQQQNFNIQGMNKSASNSRNISPQSISANLSHSNLSNSHTPRTQSKNNSQTGMPNSSLTQQLFSKKLQEQRQVNQNQVPPQQQIQIQNVNINLNTSFPTQQKNQNSIRQDSSSQVQTSPQTAAPIPAQNYQTLSNQSSSHNLNPQQQQINGSGQKVTFNIQPQSQPTLQTQQSLTSDASSHTQTNVNQISQRIQTLPSDPHLNTSQNIETEVYLQSQASQDNQNNQNQNFQLWWTEKRNTNLQFIQCAKLDKHQECIGYIDKKRGDTRAEINYKDEDQNTALHYAAQNGNAQLVNYLIYNEANIDSQNKQLMTPLMFACIEGHEDVCQLLITAGSDINNCDIKENTALHYASMSGHKNIVDILLRKPSLFYRKKNNSNLEAYQLASNDDVRKAFDNFFALQKQLLQSQQKLQIHDAQPQNVQQMFQKIPNINPDIQVENKNNGVYKKSSENDNKSSINEKNSTSDESKSSFGAQEEKVGPNDFIVHGLIGKGSFGEVYLVEKKGSQMLYAMKVLHKSKVIRHNLTKYAMTERNVMSLTNHPFIVRLNFAFQTSDKLFLIMDYCPGGDLGEHLQKEKKFSEDLVKIYLAETILALEDLHKRDVIFRDLKPDNIVLDYEGHVKLTDFGLSKEGVLDHSSGARSFCGSVAYLAPEMLKRCGHGKAVDWYLLGVVMYELLVGIPPYYANNRDELFYNIEKAPLKIPSYLSTEARSLLKALLQRNPAKRLGSGKGDAEEIKVHPFFNDIDWKEVYQRKLKPPRPNRKIRISTKFDPNLFAETDYKGEKDYISGWSFVAP